METTKIFKRLHVAILTELQESSTHFLRGLLVLHQHRAVGEVIQPEFIELLLYSRHA